MMPGVPERRTHGYVRHGTTSLFAALDVASGFVIGKCYKLYRLALNGRSAPRRSDQERHPMHHQH